MNTIFTNIFTNTATTNASLQSFLICIAASLCIGFIIALAYSFKSRHTNSFFMTVALLPAIVAVVIMMVNGNIGTGIAVAGAFSLVRFRSVPGSAKEISTIFLAMAAGLISGMGYIGYSFMFAIIFSALLVVFNVIENTHRKTAPRILKITVPEDLDYQTLFDDVLKTCCNSYTLSAVKTTNFGAMFKLTYQFELSSGTNEKEFIDKLRERNGNLEIMISREEVNYNEL